MVGEREFEVRLQISRTICLMMVLVQMCFILVCYSFANVFDIGLNDHMI